jgi:Haem-NO-binding
MYGVVNKSIEEFVVGAYGLDTWNDVLKRAEIEALVFISNEPYPDEITYRLIGAATAISGISTKDFLISLGHHWILKTGLNHYGALLSAGGHDLKEFLVNLNEFHMRVRLIFPELKPPDLSCTDVNGDSLKLHYRTHREGLGDFVIGLVQGLGALFRTPVSISLIESRAGGADHDVFEVKWSASVDRE